MELEITKQFNDDNARDFQNSAMEAGPMASIWSWNNALDSRYNYITPENKETIQQHFLDYGAWELEELQDERELGALLVQEIASNIREFESCEDWDEYEAESEAGQVSGLLFKSEDNKVYIYIGH